MGTKSMSFRMMFVFSLGQSLWLACGARETSRLHISGGAPAEAALTPTVALIKKDSQGIDYVYCTGVLLSRTHVLTAAHCSQDHQDKIYAPEEVKVIWGENSPEDHFDKALAVKALQPHPDYNAGLMGKDADGVIKPQDAFDIAVWELRSPAPTVAPLAKVLSPESASQLLSKSLSVKLMGFGAESGFESPWTKHIYREAQTPYQPEFEREVRRKERVNGRLINHRVVVRYPGHSAYEFFAGGKDLPDTCKGDSGGPVFLEPASLLLGVTSRGDATCDRGGVYSLVPAFAPWLESLDVPVSYENYGE